MQKRKMRPFAKRERAQEELQEVFRWFDSSHS